MKTSLRRIEAREPADTVFARVAVGSTRERHRFDHTVILRPAVSVVTTAMAMRISHPQPFAVSAAAMAGGQGEGCESRLSCPSNQSGRRLRHRYGAARPHVRSCSREIPCCTKNGCSAVKRCTRELDPQLVESDILDVLPSPEQLGR